MTMDIPLSFLIRLEDAGIRYAKEAAKLRPLNKSQVQRLVLSGGNWPPIETVHLQEHDKYGVIDGLHRWEAAIRLELDHITARVGTYSSDEEIVEAVLMANLSHGIPANNQVRKMLAGILYEDGMSIEEIANYVGLSERTVKLFIRKSEEEETQSSDSARPTDLQRLIGYLRQFFKRRVSAPRLYENFDRNVDNMALAQELFFYVKDSPNHIKQEVIDVCRNLYVVLAEITKER